jgi:SAM-dependent methyltransferase
LSRYAYSNLARRLRAAGLKRNDRILDYGCGNGDLLAYLQKSGYSFVQGYDPFVDSFSSEQVLQESYDVVIAKDVFEHMENNKEVLRKWKSLLRPGGLLCLSVVNADGIDLRTSGRMLHALHQPYHLHIPSMAAIESMALELGFKTISIEAKDYWDTPIPTVNRFFISEFLRTGDDTVDVAFERPRIFNIMKSPRLWFYALFGYFLNNRTLLVAILQA